MRLKDKFLVKITYVILQLNNILKRNSSFELLFSLTKS